MKNNRNKIAELYLNVSDDSDFLSKYSSGNKPIISGEVAEFLENSAKEFHPKSEIKLVITSSCVDETEKPLYIEAVKNYFSLKFSETEREIKRKTIVSLIFSIVGVIALAFMLLYENAYGNAIWTECIDIFAWVFLWEAVDQFFIERNALLLQMKRIKNFIDMDVEYK
mgnify:CR=1 FL=1